MELSASGAVLVLCAVVFFEIADGNFYRSGRHVCSQPKQVAQPVPVRQTYCRPAYRRQTQMCSGNTPCTNYNMVYQIAVKTVFMMRIRTQMVHGCCPGWSQYSQRDNGCMRPVCSGGCYNGGTCVNPDRCSCSDGFAGNTCEKDVNECLTPNHGCQQMCHNTNGSYTCSCYQGFTLSEDGMSCQFCLSCLPEFQSIHKRMNKMNNKVKQLEGERELMKSNLSVLENDYHHAMEMVDELKAVTQPVVPTTTSTTTTRRPTTPQYPYYGDEFIPMERLASLSEQISMLEERIGACDCEYRRR